MNNVTVIGHYARNNSFCNGQIIKTKIICDELKKSNSINLKIIDTFNWKKHCAELLLSTIKSCRNSNHIIMMPDYNGFRVLVKLLPVLTTGFECKLSYMVIGGWLPQFLSNNNSYIKHLNKFSNVIVETASMERTLSKLGVKNIHVIPNFKSIVPLSQAEIPSTNPFRFCIFSRIMKEKGIEDAINCIIKVNEFYKKDIAALDIYGQVDPDYEDTLKALLSNSPSYIKYNGTAEHSESVKILKPYFSLLFPTTYKTEGLPGTIIDAYSSGVPVISYEWDSSSDVIINGKTGIVCCDNVNSLYEAVIDAIDNPQKLIEMRNNCLHEAQQYTTKNNIQKLINIL